MANHKTPQSPEEYPEHVREQLNQEEVTHEGTERSENEGDASETMGSHMGAVETEQTPVTSPMEGPSKVVEGTLDDFGIDPAEEIPGG